MGSCGVNFADEEIRHAVPLTLQNACLTRNLDPSNFSTPSNFSPKKFIPYPISQSRRNNICDDGFAQGTHGRSSPAADTQHIDPDELLSVQRHKSTASTIMHGLSGKLCTPYSSRYGATEDIPKFRIPEDSLEAPAAYQLIHDEMDFDGKPNLNLASFVHTYMVPQSGQRWLIGRNRRRIN